MKLLRRFFGLQASYMLLESPYTLAVRIASDVSLLSSDNPCFSYIIHLYNL
jgi:hypothetical protein